MRPPASPVSLALALGAAAGACGGGQTRGSPFDPGWVDDRGAAMTALARSFHGTRVPLGVDVAVGVIGREALVGVPLDGGAPWTFAHALHGRPAVAGSVVVSAGGGEVFALDARTGKLLWSRTSGGRVRGAGDDGATTVVSLIPTTGLGSLVLAVAHDGTVVRQLEDDVVIGIPAVVGDSVFLPFQDHFLSVYDLPSGDERARLRFTGKMSRAFAEGGAIFAGERSATRFDDRIADPGGAATVRLPPPMGGLPDEPLWMRPGTDWLGREADAADKVRLYARPTPSGAPGVDGGRFAATYYRIALGFDAATGGLAWAHAHDADFVGGAAPRGGFALCDAQGVVTFLDGRTGATVGHVSLGRPVLSCIVQADRLTLPPAPAAPPSLTEQLAEVTRMAGADLAPLQRVIERETGSAPRSPTGAATARP
jgi:outer membrane protein assembly factor BamB